MCGLLGVQSMAIDVRAREAAESLDWRRESGKKAGGDSDIYVLWKVR